MKRMNIACDTKAPKIYMNDHQLSISTIRDTQQNTGKMNKMEQVNDLYCLKFKLHLDAPFYMKKEEIM